MAFRSFARRHPLAMFFALVFSLTWAIQIPLVLDAQSLLGVHIPQAIGIPLLLLMGWMPGVAAIIVTGATVGKSGVRTLLGRILIWRVGPKWYLVVIGGSIAIFVGSQVLDPLLGGTGLQVPVASVDLLLGLVLNFVVLFIFNSENFAWRGFALTRLQARHSALVASLILGIVEGLFHLPYLLQPGTDQQAAGFPMFMLGSIGGAIVLNWIFNNTRGSVLMPLLFQELVNTWSIVFPAPAVDQVISQWIFQALFVVAGGIVLLAYGPRRLSRKPASELPVVFDSQMSQLAGATP